MFDFSTFRPIPIGVVRIAQFIMSVRVVFVLNSFVIDHSVTVSFHCRSSSDPEIDYMQCRIYKYGAVAAGARVFTVRGAASPTSNYHSQCTEEIKNIYLKNLR